MPVPYPHNLGIPAWNHSWSVGTWRIVCSGGAAWGCTNYISNFSCRYYELRNRGVGRVCLLHSLYEMERVPRSMELYFSFGGITIWLQVSYMKFITIQYYIMSNLCYFKCIAIRIWSKIQNIKVIFYKFVYRGHFRVYVVEFTHFCLIYVLRYSFI